MLKMRFWIKKRYTLFCAINFFVYFCSVIKNQLKHKAMKNLTKAEKSQAIKRVYENIFLYSFCLKQDLQSVRIALTKKYDQRTRVAKYATIYLNELVKGGFDFEAYRNLKKTRIRALSRYILHPTQHFLMNGLFVDYSKHRKDVVSIESNRIVFSTRYHYANTDEDFKVLQVLKKHFKK
jgi:hypothetical protein